MNINFSEINLEQVIRDGEAKQALVHAKREAASLGILRVGNSGCLTADGDIIGGCHRVAILRANGVEFPINGQTNLLFSAGIAHEDLLATKLQDGWIGNVLREEQALVEWKTKNRSVTGRPDFLLTHNGDDQSDSNRKVGVELKTLASTSAAETLYFGHKPKVEHLCQSGNYMLEHNTPWVLCYINPNSLDTSFFVKKRKENLLPSGKVNWKLKVPPFRMYFYLSFIDGVLHYRCEVTDSKGPVRSYDPEMTVITSNGIKEYFEVLDEMLVNNELGEEIKHVNYDGSSLPWDHAKYCEACSMAREDSRYAVWLDKCRDRADTLKREIEG